jgi:hypothetical protein
MSFASAPPAKRRKRSTALVEDDVDTADAITHGTVTKITRSGATKIKTVLVPLVPIVDQEDKTLSGPVHEGAEINFSQYENADAGHNSPSKTSKVVLARPTFAILILH